MEARNIIDTYVWTIFEALEEAAVCSKKEVVNPDSVDRGFKNMTRNTRIVYTKSRQTVTNALTMPPKIN